MSRNTPGVSAESGLTLITGFDSGPVIFARIANNPPPVSAENNLPRRGYGYVSEQRRIESRARSARMADIENNAPATVWEDIGAIVSSLQPGDSEYIRSLPEADLICLHRTLGLNLRNAFRSGRYRHLLGYCSDQETSETRSFDSISETAIRLVWGHLRAAPEAEPGGLANGGP